MSPAPPNASQRDGRGELEQLIEAQLSYLRTYVDLNLGGLLRLRTAPSDIVQSTIRQVLDQGERLELRGEGPFRAYLCTVAANKILEKYRHNVAQRRDVRRELSLDAEPEGAPHDFADHAPSPAAHAQQVDEFDRLRRAFDSLSDEDRQILSLKRILRLSTAEIAAELGIAPRTVSWRVSVAQTRLAAALERNG